MLNCSILFRGREKCSFTRELFRAFEEIADQALEVGSPLFAQPCEEDL